MDFDALANITVGNQTHLGWVDGPNQRGTFSIMISCITTLMLCTLSAMHLNIPKRHESKAGHFRTQAFWTCVGVLGPELAIWCAWRQYMSAKALRDQIREAVRDSGKDDNRHEEWTMAHGFYAAMGGLVIDLDEPDHPDIPRFLKRTTRLTLTPKATLLLARCGFLPCLWREEIKDKSETDGIGKLFACVQALWMLVQVITRIIKGLPITLLEVFTLGHVLRALILYGFWWHKPRGVSEPTRLEGDWVPTICSFMCMASKIDDGHFHKDNELKERFAVDMAEIAHLRYIYDATPVSDPTEPRRARAGSSGSFVSRPRKDSETEKHTIGIENATMHSNHALDSVTKTRHDLACQAIAQYPAVRDIMQYPVPAEFEDYATALQLYPEMPDRAKRRIKCWKPASTEWLECSTEHLVSKSASNWPSEGDLRSTSGLATGTILWLSTIAFSAVHIAAWNESFPSIIEAWLWRSSALYLGFSGCLWSLLDVVANMSACFWWLWYDLLTREGHVLLKPALMGVCSVCGTAYLFARLFLVVDSFATLRSLPVAAFLVPQWAVYVPHV